MTNHLIIELSDAIEKNKKNKAISIFNNGMLEDATCFTKQIKKKGVFRASKYEFKAKIIKQTIDSFFIKKNDYSVSADIIIYLKSVLALLHIAFSVRTIYKKNWKNLSKKDFKASLVSIELLFWKFHKKNDEPIRKTYKNFSMEDLSSAFSFFYYCLSNKFDSAELDMGIIDANAIKKEHYINKINDLAKCNFFKDCEILVDYFGYKATRKKSTVNIEAPCSLFEKSRQLGYIYYQMQSYHDYESFSKYDEFSLCKLAKEIVEKYKDILFSIKKHPIERIVMEFSCDANFKKLILNDILFREEVNELRCFAKVNFLSSQQIKEIVIYDNLTIIDIIKFQRFFKLLYLIYKKYIFDNCLKESELFLQSVLPVYSDASLYKLLEFIYGEEKSKSLLTLFSWESSTDTIFDLQSKPIIKCGKQYICPIGLIAQTNLVRNVLQQTRFRFDSNSAINPLEDKLEKTLKSHSKIVCKNISYNFGKEEGEIDLLAIIDKCIFVFECKNSLHPCNIYEFRTSYDYIKKAGKQLSKFQQLFNDLNFRNYIASLIGCEELSDIKLVTCIITGNRMLSGWQEQGHNIRPIHELCNVIEKGTINFKIRSNKNDTNISSIKLWENDSFSETDLVNYINNDYLYELRFNSMVESEAGIEINGKKLVKKSYVLDIQNLYNEYSNKFN